MAIGYAKEFIYNPSPTGVVAPRKPTPVYGFRLEHSFITLRSALGGRHGSRGDGAFGLHNGNGMMPETYACAAGSVLMFTDALTHTA